MTVIDLNVAPSQSNLAIDDKDRLYESDSGVIQVQSNSGARFTLTLTWTNVNGARLQDLRGIWFALKGRRNQLRVDLSTMVNYVRQGSGASSPVINGTAAVGATQIAVDNGTLSTADLWKRGDLISIGDQMYGCASDYDADGAGEGTVDIWPPLHAAVAVTSPLTPIDDVSPHGVFFLIGGSGFGNEPHVSGAEISRTVRFDLTQDVTA